MSYWYSLGYIFFTSCERFRTAWGEVENIKANWTVDISMFWFFFFFPLGNRSTEECRCCFTRFKLHKQNKRFRCFHLHQVHSWSGNLATLPEVRGYFVLLSKVSEWSKLQMYLGWCIFGCIYRLGEESLDKKPCKEGFGGSDWWEAEYESVVCYGSKKGQLYSRVHQAPC